MWMMFAGVAAASEADLVYGTEAGITRAEWLHDLVVVFDMTVEEDNYPDEYFSDITSESGHEYYSDIMTATEFGVVDVEAGEELKPNDPVTREFAAHTLNYCLGYRLEESEYQYDLSDKADVNEPYLMDVQVALNRGWFMLSGEAFQPQAAVTQAEAEKMFTDAQAVLASDVIDENHEDSYTFADDVTKVPDGTSYLFGEDGTAAIYNTSLDIQEGGRFALFQNGIPQIYKAIAVTTDEEQGALIVTMEKVEAAEAAEAVVTADAEGVVEADLNQAVAAEGVTITYIEGGTEEAAYADGIAYTSPILEGEHKISAVKFEKSFKLATGITTKISATVSNAKVGYKCKGLSEAKVYIKGDMIVSGSVKVSSDGLTGSSKFLLGSIPFGFADISVYAIVKADGTLTVACTNGFDVGVEYTKKNGFRLLTSFHKKAFRMEAKIEAQVAVQAVGKFNVWLAEGSVSAEAGAKAEFTHIQYGDGGTPAVCDDVFLWLYAQADADMRLLLKKYPHKNVPFFDKTNSPVRLGYHWEDGVRTAACSRTEDFVAKGGKKPKYTTIGNSRYGSSGDGYYIDYDTDGTLKVQPVFTYRTQKDDNGDTVAVITGYTGDAYALQIPEEIDGYKVSVIGSRAFENRGDLYMVTIPDTVTEIEGYAFGSCPNLSEVELSNNLVKLGNYAFNDCDKLTSIYIPKSLTQCGTGGMNTGAFSFCSALEHVMFEEGITQIVGNLFENCDGLKEITIPDTVTRISGYAFRKCINLKSITVPENVTEIGDRAFEGCTSLTMAQIADSVTTIWTYAFADCPNLSEVKLSNNLVELWNYAFSDCDKLTSIYIPKSLTKGGSGSINTGAFSNCSALEHVTFEEGTTQIVCNLFENCDGLKEITIPDTVTRVSAYAFRNCINLNSITVPGSVTEIEINAFEGCTGLTKAVIADSVVKIGNSAFKDCTKLAEVELPKELKMIEYRLFSNCAGLQTITIPETVEKIDDNAFEGTGLMTVKIPDSVTTIGNTAFYNCDALTEIRLPDTVSSIGTYCFAECDELASVRLGTGITTIPSYAFHQCQKLGSIVLPYRVATVENNAFTNCTELVSVTIPRSVTSIADKDNASATVFSYPDRMTIYGVKGTYAEEYATAKGIRFEENAQQAASAKLNKEELTLTLGTSHMKEMLALTVEPEDFVDDVAWKTINNDGVITVDNSGLVTAQKAGTATVRVTVGNSLGADCAVTVVQAPTSVSLTQTSHTMEALEEFQLEATVYPDNAYNKDVEWNSSDEKVAVVSESGLVTAVGKGSAVITAKALGAENVKGECRITVTNNGTVVKSLAELESPHPYTSSCTDFWIYTDPNGAESLSLVFDERTELEEGTDYLYIYDGKGSEIGNYTGTGLAGQTVVVPGSTVKIKLVSDSGYNTWGFAVLASGETGGDPDREEQKITGTELYEKVYGDDPFTLDAELVAGNGALSYNSDTPEVADVDESGTVTIGEPGKAVITVTAAGTEEFLAAELKVTVNVSKAEQTLTVGCEKDTILAGETLQLAASSETGLITYVSDDENVAQVDENGLVTGIAEGVAGITVRSAGNEHYLDAKDYYLTVTVEETQEIIPIAICRMKLSQNAYVYDGNPKKPGVTITRGTITLQENIDYILNYENNVEPGMATVTAEAVEPGRYTGSISETFTIMKAPSEDSTSIEAGAFRGSDLKEARIGESVTEIGDYAFADCTELTDVRFSGSAPQIGENAFLNDNLTARYPGDDPSWTPEVRQQYGGNITWIPWDPQTGEDMQTDLAQCTVLVVAVTAYDGTEKCPAVTVRDGAAVLAEHVDYEVTGYSDNVHAGMATVTLKGIGKYGGTLGVKFEIPKAQAVLKYEQPVITKTYGDADFTERLQYVTDGTVTYSSGSTGVAQVDARTGMVHLVSAGRVTITAQAAEGRDYKAGSASYELNILKKTNVLAADDITRSWSKKAQKVRLTYTSLSSDYSFKSDTDKVTVDSKGNVKIAAKFAGIAKITIAAKETSYCTSASTVVTVSVKPPTVRFRKVTNTKGRKITAAWSKNKVADGYMIQYSTSKKFKSGVRKKTLGKKTKFVTPKLKKGKTYYVRICTYVNTGSGKYCSNWSKAKKVKIKK